MQGVAEALLGLRPLSPSLQRETGGQRIRLRRSPTSRAPKFLACGLALSHWAPRCPRGWLQSLLFPKVGHSSRWQHVWQH